MSVRTYREMLDMDDLSKEQLEKVIRYIDADLDNMGNVKKALYSLKKEAGERLKGKSE